MSLGRRFIRVNMRLSRAFDKLLPPRFKVDGNTEFQKIFAPAYLTKNAVVYDIGGGKQPFVEIGTKRELGLTVVGIDISARELAEAPDGIYDRTITADITSFNGSSDADVVICRAVLEHVRDTELAFRAISSCLRTGGVACIFVPSKNAIFARLNMLLPQRVKEFILYSVFPSTRASQGFRSYYDKCTPTEFEWLGEKYGMKIIDEKRYFVSSYFSFFMPAYVLWRMWVLLYAFVGGRDSAETFSMAFRKG